MEIDKSKYIPHFLETIIPHCIKNLITEAIASKE